MKRLVIIRHGHYEYKKEEPGGLSEIGRLQIGRLTKILLANSLLRTGPKVLSSTAQRAMESAMMLAKELNVRTQGSNVLWSGPDREFNLARAYQFISREGEEAETLFVVTHLEYADQLLEFFATQEQWPVLPPQPKHLEQGEAIVIDLEKRVWAIVSPASAVG